MHPIREQAEINYRLTLKAKLKAANISEDLYIKARDAHEISAKALADAKCEYPTFAERTRRDATIRIRNRGLDN